MTENDIGTLRSDLHHLEILMARELGEIKILIGTEAQRCPYRETISTAASTGALLATLTKTVEQGRVDAAKAAITGGATTGGVIAMMTAIIVGVGKILGWW